MARRKVTFVQGEYYHIYNRGCNRRSILPKPSTRKKRLSALTNNSLDIQRMEAGQQEYHLEPLALQQRGVQR